MISKLLRVYQWYKNILVFLPLIFFGFDLTGNQYLSLVLGFFALCLISSTNYIINDIFDKEKDKLDKTKSKRPIAAGKVSIPLAIVFAVILLLASLIIGYVLNPLFFVLLLLLFVLTFLYSIWLKHKVFIDIIVIAINFMIRAICGAIILHIYISEWFILGVFFLAMFFVFAKRYGESKEGLQKNRKLLEFYTPELMQMFMIVFLAILVIFYSVYIIIEHSGYWFLATVPVFTLLLLRYFSLVIRNTDVARHGEKTFFKLDLVLLAFLWLLLFLFAMYKYKWF